MYQLILDWPKKHILQKHTSLFGYSISAEEAKIYGIGTCPVFEVTPLGDLVEGEVVAGRIAEKITNITVKDLPQKWNKLGRFEKQLYVLWLKNYRRIGSHCRGSFLPRMHSLQKLILRKEFRSDKYEWWNFILKKLETIWYRQESASIGWGKKIYLAIREFARLGSEKHLLESYREYWVSSGIVSKFTRLNFRRC